MKDEESEFENSLYSVNVGNAPILQPSVYCPMRLGVCAKFQFSPPHHQNSRARASPAPASQGARSRTFARLRCPGIIMMGNIICLSRDNCYNASQCYSHSDGFLRIFGG